jgi:NAD(P)-dependent dehydrogenase (short-subunit alcohol dehydrogenase family)
MPIADFSATPYAEIVSLAGRRAVVTGGARGIGQATARRLAEAGAAVVIGDLDHRGAQDSARDIAGATGTVVQALPLDVADEASLTEFAEAATAAMGGLDIWVNNAGVYPAMPALEITIDDWDKVQAINLRGAFLGAREAAKGMTASGSECGVIVNIASMAGLRAQLNMAHYVSAKHGVVGLTKALALEFGPLDIRVMAIAPALIVTQGLADRLTPESIAPIVAGFPLGRAGVPDDIARVVLFCASDLAAFMTGSTLQVDAGSWAGVFSASGRS